MSATAFHGLGRRRVPMTLGQRLARVPWTLVTLISVLSAIGVVVLYSGAGGQLEPWAVRQIYRFGVGFALMIAVALIDIRVWYRVAYPAYVVSLLLLIGVHFWGASGMGAQRWLTIGPVRLQPSEVMKVALVVALARFFHGLNPQDIARPLNMVWPTLLVLVPTALILKQPKLGSAMLILMTAAAIFFCAGVRIWKFITLGAVAAAALPSLWAFLRDYQKQRVLTLLSPESDPLGAGYHIIQSKIALGSGGIWGKGFLNGTQSHLDFLPERQTDFVFSMFAEEFGLVGGFVLLGLYTLVVLVCLAIAGQARSQFARLVTIGIVTGFFANSFVNMAMVMGLIPVVGEPLPFISYGGTALITLLFGFGLVMSVKVHAETSIGPRGFTETWRW